jgi:UDP-glucose 4-epimerase
MSGAILITGANGYLGSKCIENFARLPDREIVATWHSGTDRLLQPPPSHVHYERSDLTDRAQLRSLLQRWRVQTVIHTAALLPDEGADYLVRAVQANVAATANLAQSAAEEGCARFVYCSSISVYGTSACPHAGWNEVDPVAPSTSYGWSKYAGEECVRLCAAARAGFSAMSLRLAGIHGQGRCRGALFHMTRAALAGEPLVVNGSTGRFQLLFLSDAVNAIRAAAERHPSNSFERINVASEVFPSLRQMAEGVIQACRSKSEIRMIAGTENGEQLMNTDRMKAFLVRPTAALAAQVREIRNALEGVKGQHV